MKTLIERIKAEVERLKGQNNCGTSEFIEAKGVAYNQILSFLSTLQEQPVKDFPTTDEEMQHFLATHKPVQVPEKYKTADWIFKEQPVWEKEAVIYCYDNGLNLSPRVAKDFARHFYELGRQSKPKVCEGLEDEICKYFTKHPVKDLTNWPTLKNVALHFAKWGAEHARKETPVSDDLVEAAVNIADALLSKPKDYVLSAKADYWNGAHDGIIAGAKWKKEQMISALKNDGELPVEFIDKFHEIDRNAFQNGQENMKEQMLKEAVEATVVSDPDAHGADYGLQKLEFAYRVLETKGIPNGRKVRIVIVKEEGK